MHCIQSKLNFYFYDYFISCINILIYSVKILLETELVNLIDITIKPIYWKIYKMKKFSANQVKKINSIKDLLFFWLYPHVI